MANALVLLGAGSSGSGTLTPPSVAPVLTATSSLGSYVAVLEWTASNKTVSPGFQYVVYFQVGANPEGVATYTTDLTYNFEDLGATGELYNFRVVPENSAGEGPSSNTASVVLPGESSSLLLNAGGEILLNQTGDLLING